MKLAKLDADGELLAVEDVPPGQWLDSDTTVRLPDDTDLIPGRARWDRKRKTFHIRPPEGDGPSLPAIDGAAIAAIALALLELRKHGQKFPNTTERWLDSWAGSVDAAGLVDRKGQPL